MVLHKYTTSTLSAAIPKGNEPEIKNTKEKHHSIEDLVKSAIKLSVSDLLDIDRASLIPGEAVEANLADFKRFITDGAWKAVCKLG